MKTNLYNIETEYLTLMGQVEDAEGELTPELEEALSINEAQLQSKSIAYLHIIKELEARNAAIDLEVKRLLEIKKRGITLIDRLKGRVLGAIALFGEFTAGIYKFCTRKSSSVEVDSVNTLDPRYKVVKITESADKKAIKEAIKSGKEIEGCRIVDKLGLKIN